MRPVVALDGGQTEIRADQLRLGLWMFLGTVTMLFAAFTSAYIVRRSGSDWSHLWLPRVLWLNTLVLAASSVALEAAHWSGARRHQGAPFASSAAFGAAIVLGLGFVAGQIAAWRQLVAAGVYLPSSPNSSFFYVLTGAHAIHVIAALAVLTWGAAATRTAALSGDSRKWATAMSLCRTFWHYLGAVWVYLFVLVSVY